MTPARILVVKRDKIGDMLLTTPLLAHLRAWLPQTRIEVLCTDYNGWVIDRHPAVDRRWELPRVRVGPSICWSAVLGHAAMRAKLRFARYDAVIVAQGEESPRAVRRGFAVRSPRCIAYASSPEHYGRRLTDPLPVPPDDVHEIDRILALGKALGIPPPPAVRYPEYVVSDRARQFAEQWLAARGIAPGNYVVLGLGARRAARQPSAQQVARWSRRWLDDYGLHTVFVWTPGATDNPIYPGDDDVAEPVLRMAFPHVHPYRGPLIETIALIWRARTSVFPDSGLMHFGAASPGGVLGLFARSGPPAQRWAPRGARARWVQAEDDVPNLADDAFFASIEPLLAAALPAVPLAAAR